MITSQYSHEGESAAITLYRALLDSWNQRSAFSISELFAKDGSLIGFDGSTLDGPKMIMDTLGGVFSSHLTPSFVGIVRSVRFVSDEVALLRAVAGMWEHGGTDINPALNAVQTLVAERKDGQWRILLFQNTPAAFHGQEEERAKLTEELRARMLGPDKPAN